MRVTPTSRLAPCLHLGWPVGKTTLTSLQAVVGLLAGLTSVVGATYSGLQYLRSPDDAGEMVAVVREARTDTPIRDATVEVLTAQDTLVTTLTATEDGSARRPLKPGFYRVWVRHPRYGAEGRDIEVQRGQVAEVRFQLAQRTGRASASPLDGVARGVERGANAAGRFLRNLGR